MRGVALGQVAALLFAAATAPVRAAPAAPQLWKVDWEQERCTISTGDPASAFVALWVTPADPNPELYVVAPADRLRGGGDSIKLTLAPAGPTVSAPMIKRAGQGGATVAQMYDLEDSFPAAFAKASEVRLAGFAKPLAIPLKGADQAMAALRTCLDDKMKEWGIDATAYNALRAAPKDPSHFDWLTDADYPADAQANGLEGDAVVRLRIDTKGRVTDCAVMASSGSPTIDKVTCDKALHKARFTPAVGADGRPIAAVRTIRAKFRLMTS